MSAFLEEYGKVIIVIIVIAALILLATVFKSIGSRAAGQSFDAFMGKAATEVEASTDKKINVQNANDVINEKYSDDATKNPSGGNGDS